MRMKKKDKKLIKVGRLARKVYVEGNAYYDRGRGQFGRITDLMQISVMGGMGIELLNRWTPLSVPMSVMPKLALAFIVLCLVYGFVDKKWLHVWQAEHAFQYRSVNPVLAGIERTLNQVKRIVQKNIKVHL